MGCTPLGVSWMETVGVAGTAFDLTLLDEVDEADFFDSTDLDFAFLDDGGGSVRENSITRGRSTRSIASWMCTSSLFESSV